MNNFILIAHGAWFQADGRPANGRDALYTLPKDLIIKTYSLQNTSISKDIGFMILNNIRQNNGDLGLQNGENELNGVNIIYKEYSCDSQSSMISDYSIRGDDTCPTGVYEIGVNDILVRMKSDFNSCLSDIINENRITNVLHLICCQNFH